MEVLVFFIIFFCPRSLNANKGKCERGEVLFRCAVFGVVPFWCACPADPIFLAARHACTVWSVLIEILCEIALYPVFCSWFLLILLPWDLKIDRARNGETERNFQVFPQVVRSCVLSEACSLAPSRKQRECLCRRFAYCFWARTATGFACVL